MAQEVSKADAIADLERVADELGRPPKIADYREHGDYSARTVAKRFDGSFTDARAAALDCGDGRQPEIARDELLADIERVAEVVGGEPSKDDYKSHGDHALSTITYRFETWVDAKQAAGVYDGLDDGPTRSELIADLQRVDDEHVGPVTQTVYQEHGEWSFKSVQRRFGGWEEGCAEAGVTRPTKGPRTEETAALLDDIRRVADELGHPPSRTEYHEKGRFSRQMAITRLGSWPDAVRRAGYEPREPGGQPGEMNANWEGGCRRYYGASWHEQRRAARQRDGFECADCGMAEEEHLAKFGWELEVHHIVPFRTFDDSAAANELENLVTLCRTHHREYEGLPAEEALALLQD